MNRSSGTKIGETLLLLMTWPDNGYSLFILQWEGKLGNLRERLTTVLSQYTLCSKETFVVESASNASLSLLCVYNHNFFLVMAEVHDLL